MSAICGILRDSFDDYLADRLPAPQRRILREHLAACDGCRAAAADKDASFVFARPLPEQLAPSETAAILASVRTGVAHLEAERRIAVSRPSRRRSAVAAVAAAVGLLALTVAGGSSRREAVVVALPVATPAPARAAVPVAGGELEAAGLSGEPAASPSNATVYDLNPGAGREEPRVVWIVDRGLDI